MVPAPAAAVSLSGLEIAYLLAVGFVDMAQWPPERQTEALDALLKLARETDAFRRAEASQAVVCHVNGEGLILAFLRDVQAPGRCALQLVNALKANPLSEFRMGLHCGTVTISREKEIPCAVEGEELATAQRIRDYGDAGHILLSGAAAGDLSKMPLWPQYLHDLEIRGNISGVQIPLFSLYDLEFGNRIDPEWIRQRKSDAKKRAARAFEIRVLIGRAFRSLLILGCGLALAWYVRPYAERYLNISLPFSQTKPPPPHEPLLSEKELKEVGKILRKGRQKAAAGTARGSRPGASSTPGAPPPLKAQPLLMPPASGEPVIEEPASSSASPAGSEETGTATEEMQSHSFERTLQIPADGRGERKVRITYEDGSITKPELVLNESHIEGDSIPIKIEYRGRRLTLHLYYDDWLVKSWTFELPLPAREAPPAENDGG